MRLSYTDIVQHNTSYQGHSYLFRSMIRILKVESELLPVVRLVKHHGWQFVSFEYVGVEQVL